MKRLPSLRLRTAALTALFSVMTFFVSTAPTDLPLPRPEALTPQPAAALGCASTASFEGHLTASSGSTTAITRSTTGNVFAYVSKVTQAWSCTAYNRYDGLAWVRQADLKGDFDWGSLINSTSVPCNYVLNETTYVKANSTNNCHTSDAQYALPIYLEKTLTNHDLLETTFHNDTTPDEPGDFMFIHTDCLSYYSSGGGEQVRYGYSFAPTEVNNRPGDNCDPLFDESTNTTQAIVVDGTPPALAFDWPPAGGPALVTSAFAAIKFDATDNVAMFGASPNDWDLQRQVATWSGSACGTFADDATAGSLESGLTSALDQVSSQGLLDNTCYRWTLAAKDLNGNTATTVTSGSIRTDLSGNLGQQAQHTFESWDLGAGDALSVNVGTGNLVIRHPLVSLPIRGSSVELSLTYNRHDATNVGMGPGWRLNAFRRLALNGDGTVTFTDADGSRHTFSTPVVNGSITTYTRPATLYATLVKDTTLTANEFVLTYRDQSKDKFDIVGFEGLLVREEDEFGNAVTLAYTGGTNRISTITDTAGGSTITLTWDGSNRLSTITDWAVVSGGVVQTSGTPNRIHRFLYDGSGNLASWADPLYTTGTCPTGGSHLTCVTYPTDGLDIAKTQTVTTIGGSPVALDSTTQIDTTKVVFANADVMTVKDAQEMANGSAGTAFSHSNPYETQVVRRGTSGSSLDTTTRYALLSAGDPHARIATAARKLGASWLKTTTTYDASYPIEPATVTEDVGGSLQRATTTTYVASSLGLVSRIDAPLDGTYRHYTDFTYNASNNMTQKIESRQGDATLRTTTRYCYSSTSCGTADNDLRLFRTIANYQDETKGGANGHVEDVTVEYLYDSYGRVKRETRFNYTAGGSLVDSRVNTFCFSADCSTNDGPYLVAEIANYVSGSVTNPGDDVIPNALTNARTDLMTVHTYDTAGNRVSTADPRRAIRSATGPAPAGDDFVTRWTFDALNQQVTEKTPTTPDVSITQKTQSRVYDELGQIRSATDFGGLVTASKFDRAGRPIETYRDSDGAGSTPATITGKSDYDPSGRLLWSEDETQATDPAGGTDPGRTEKTYDELGQATSTVEAAGSATPAIASTTATAYDALGRSIDQTVGTESGAAQRTRTGYDPGDRLTSVDDEFTCTTTTYDWRSQATQIVEGKVSGAPCSGSGTQTIDQAFDGLARMTSRAVAGGATLEAATYDSVGRATKTWSVTGTTSRAVETTFNLLDEPTTEYRYVDTSGTKSAETWARANHDAAGNETDRCTWTAQPTEWCQQADGTFTNPQPTTKSSSRFDARNKRVEQYTPGLGATTYDPDHNYQVSAVYLPTASGKEHQTVNTYDVRHRLDTINHVLCATNQRPCVGGNILSSTTADDYGYDANDNRTEVIEDNGAGALTRHYCHDARNQLAGIYSTAGCSTGLLEAYGYDASSNRTSAAGRTFTYDAEGQLSTCSGTTCAPTFDTDGRLTKITAASGTWSYEYDGESRLIRACKAASCTTGTPDKLEFTYDGEGHRTQTKTFTAGVLLTTTDFRYQGDAVASEVATTGATVITRTFTSDDAGAIVKVAIATSGGSTADDGNYLVTWNGHGDALGLYEISGTGTLIPAMRYTYTTWGTPTTTPQSGYGDLGFRYLYVGRFDVQWDDFAGAGLLYMHARHYSPEFGRFLQPDPAAAEPNLYAYGAGNPVTNIDPTGTYFKLIDGSGGAAAGGGGGGGGLVVWLVASGAWILGQAGAVFIRHFQLPTRVVATSTPRACIPAKGGGYCTGIALVARRILEKELKDAGFRPCGGSKHEKWCHPDGRVALLPRHKEISIGVARDVRGVIRGRYGR
jgi:RHS repeat-associated protein